MSFRRFLIFFLAHFLVIGVAVWLHTEMKKKEIEHQLEK
jgi:hypothetical protein